MLFFIFTSGFNGVDQCILITLLESGLNAHGKRKYVSYNEKKN